MGDGRPTCSRVLSLLRVPWVWGFPWDSSGDSCGYGVGMGIEMPSPRQPWLSLWICLPVSGCSEGGSTVGARVSMQLMPQSNEQIIVTLSQSYCYRGTVALYNISVTYQEMIPGKVNF